VLDGPASGNFFTQTWGSVKGTFRRGCGQPFQSDHAGDFDLFASPVSSPFLSEDPRALTELKPVFMYQSIPDKNGAFGGGSVEFFGLQGRVALTERWSIVMNKLGGVFFQPSQDPFGNGNQNGFAEVWLGPKYTFLRDPVNNTAAAVGMTFQIPTGSPKVFQDTGSLTLSPYFSFAKSFGRLPRGFGNFNFMSTSGYAFSVDSERSDYFYSNLHLDFDVGGQHRLYPLIELNYVRYTTSGGLRPINFEGADLVNFGATNISDKSQATFAVGARYKLGGRENIQFGGAFEFPLSSNNNFNDFRVTLDVIFRY
jgi:hypothetical protein